MIVVGLQSERRLGGCASGERRQLPLRIGIAMAPFSMMEMQANKVVILGRPRSVPVAKNIGWVQERRYLEMTKPDGAAEVLLVNQDGDILEGMVTNFFVVVSSHEQRDDIYIQTAPVSSGVVWGTMRARVIEACNLLGLPVVERAPRLEDCDKWTEAFLTNRWVEKLVESLQ